MQLKILQSLDYGNTIIHITIKNKPVESKEDKIYLCAYCNKHFDYYQSRWRYEKSYKLLLKKPLFVKYNELSLELLNLHEKNNKNKKFQTCVNKFFHNHIKNMFN